MNSEHYAMAGKPQILIAILITCCLLVGTASGVMYLNTSFVTGIYYPTGNYLRSNESFYINITDPYNYLQYITYTAENDPPGWNTIGGVGAPQSNYTMLFGCTKNATFIDCNVGYPWEHPGMRISVAWHDGTLMQPVASWYDYSDPAITPVCSFTANPMSGAAPLTGTITDTSANTPTSWSWDIVDNATRTTETMHSTWQNPSYTLYNTGTFDVNMTATNSAGSCNLFVPDAIIVTNATTTTLSVSVYDAITHSSISGASVGLQNITSSAWTNATAPTGTYTFSSSDGGSAIPLSVSQMVYVAASAYGYSPNGHSVTIPYSGYPTSIALMPITAVNETGTFWLTVEVLKNEDGLPLNSAVVQVLSGGNSYQGYTASNGMITFQNITSSTTFAVTAFAQAYTQQSKTLPVTGDFMNVSFSLVRIGGTPVTTPVSPTATSTTAPVVTWTNPETGLPVSAQEGNVFDAFAKLAAALGAFFDIGIGIILIWLFWVLVYEMTGGKVIEKLMRRGRR